MIRRSCQVEWRGVKDIFGPARTSSSHGSGRVGWVEGGGGSRCQRCHVPRDMAIFGKVIEGQLLLPLSRFGLAVRR